jgi:hypothetical protein
MCTLHPRLAKPVAVKLAVKIHRERVGPAYWRVAEVIADLLGHSRTGITMDFYSHILP